MADISSLKLLANPWIALPLLILAAVVAAYFVRLLTLWILRRALETKAAEIYQRIYRLVGSYLLPFLIVGGLLLIEDAVPLPAKLLSAVHRLLIVSSLVLLLFLLAKASLLVLRNVEARYEAMGNIKGPIEILTKIVFIAVGGMIILDNLSISLTPIITTLGIGSLAVAIALQDTLGNFFAGLYLKADLPIEEGHYVRLESGQEGFVDRMGWRSTRIRTLQHNTVVVPNSKLAQSIITNFALPDERMALQIPVGIAYDSDPERVEEILMDEVKRAVGEVEGLVGDPNPSVRLIPGFGEFSLNFTITCQVRRFVDQFVVQDELRKRILRRLEKERIQIPFHRAYVKPESGAA